jgi:hypothetical protein
MFQISLHGRSKLVRKYQLRGVILCSRTTLKLMSVGIVMMFVFDIEDDLVGLYFVMRLFVIRL